jgi:hypothetical protein
MRSGPVDLGYAHDLREKADEKNDVVAPQCFQAAAFAPSFRELRSCSSSPAESWWTLPDGRDVSLELCAHTGEFCPRVRVGDIGTFLRLGV